MSGQERPNDDGPNVYRKTGKRNYYVKLPDPITGKPRELSTQESDIDRARDAARRMAGVVPSASSPAALANVLVEARKEMVLYKASPGSLQFFSKKAAQLLAFFGPKKDVNSFTKENIGDYIRKRRQDIITPSGLGLLSIADLPQRVARIKKRMASGESGYAASRAESIPYHLLDGLLHPRKERRVSDATIEKEINVLLAALRSAPTGVYQGDTKKLKPKRMEKSPEKDRFLTRDEYLALWNAIREDRKDWIIAFVISGCRYGELHRIEGKYIDHKHQRVQLLGHKGGDKYKVRWVKINTDCYAMLKRRAEATPRGLLFPHPVESCPIALGASEDDEQCTCGPAFHKILRTACRKAQIEMCSPNDMRRTFCTWFLESGGDILTCKKFMGHSPNSTMVESVYRRLFPDAGSESVKTFVALPTLGAKTRKRTKQN